MGKDELEYEQLTFMIISNLLCKTTTHYLGERNEISGPQSIASS